jgi:hypothetical protein
MDITLKALRSLPDEWLEQLAEECDPDGDFQLSGFSPQFIVWQSIDSPDIREQISEMLSTLNEDVSHVN